jgi:tetratricopeptide (TPR) repeat protein
MTTGSPDQTAPLEGTLLGERYRLDRLLGRGGMGTIYQARDGLLDRDVAVKLMLETRLGTEGRARLLKEARAAARLNHPNIVTIYDAGETDRTPYIVMELVEGVSLYERMPQALDEIVAIGRQVCAALAHAHAQGIVHRDLKPENILVTRTGQAKLTDFGLAHSISSRLTEEGSLLGTVFYMAPEVAMGQAIDGRADLYALGVMLYEMTAGRLPFAGQDPLQVISQHLHAPIVPPSTYRHEIPPGLDGLIVRLLAKSPEDRYPEATEVEQALMWIAQAEEAPAVQEEAGRAAPLEKLGRGRLIGRGEEVVRLRDAWTAVARRASPAHLILVSGEPGVGKTRLASEVMVYARLSGATVLQGGSYEYEATTPFMPFNEALRAWIHAQSDDTLREVLGRLAPELSKLAPEIDRRIGPLAPNPPLPSNEERLRLFDSVMQFFSFLAEQRGLLLFLDDLQWADQGSLALLHYLLRGLRGERFLIVGAYRESDLARTHPLAAALADWNRERLLVRIPLGRLDVREVGRMLATLLGQEEVSEELAQVIFDETEGNPYFVEETVKALIEQGQIYRQDGHWALQPAGDLQIPQSVKEAVGRRLDRQSASCGEVLHVAAVLGRRFEFGELSTAAALTEDEILDALDEACAAQLLAPEGQDAFTFTHDKIREVLYEELNPIRRRRIHQRVVEGLESLAGSLTPASAEELAHHALEAGDLPRGLRYALQAAEQAERVHAYDEAVSYYAQARECSEALPGRPQSSRILRRVGDLQHRRGLFLEAFEAFSRALEQESDPGERAVLKSLIGGTYVVRGEGQGLRYVQEALDELNPVTQANEVARAHSNLGRYFHYHGQPAQAIEELEKALAMALPFDDPATLAEIYVYLAGASQFIGNPQMTVHWSQALIDLGERRDYPLAVALGYEDLAEAAFLRGRWDETLEMAQRGEDIARRIGSSDRIAWARNSQAFGLHGKGELHAALEATRSGIALADMCGEMRLSVLLHSKRAAIAHDLGMPVLSRDDLAFVGAQAAETGQSQMAWWLATAEAFIALASRDWNRLLDVVDRAESILGFRPRGWEIPARSGLGQSLSQEFANGLLAELEDRELSDHDQGSNAWQIALVYASRGESDKARQWLDHALRSFELAGSRLHLARAFIDRALLVRSLGEDPTQDLRQAAQIFEACGAAPEAEMASNPPD